eukprot:CAMPEP_0174738406 /NCGR_PEP_ID=MMETSP1094-20130205/69888_1 /TAXON_ID=156173 /ORGANISM="Chrysochromulina brevifilum, Strain UTEX LB 985" /LENGTH=37 /DNA_ID= /DNA_START= /DNA_END= /DNA_ORIENTATION=
MEESSTVGMSKGAEDVAEESTRLVLTQTTGWLSRYVR